jgi:hypothetical protein
MMMWFVTKIAAQMVDPHHNQGQIMGGQWVWPCFLFDPLLSQILYLTLMLYEAWGSGHREDHNPLQLHPHNYIHNPIHHVASSAVARGCWWPCWGKICRH